MHLKIIFSKITSDLILNFFSLILFSLLFSACGKITKLNKIDFSDEYLSDLDNFQSDFAIFHLDSSKSEVIIHLPNNAALFMKDSNLYVARIKIDYELFANYNSKAIVDSGNKVIFKYSLNTNDEINDSIIFPINFGEKLYLLFTIRDLNRNKTFVRTLEINKLNSFQRQNYLLLNEKKQIQFNNYILNNNHFNIWSGKDSNSFYHVRCYFKKYPIAVMPFKQNNVPIFSFKPDSIFDVFKSDVSNLTLNRYGFYHFQTDTSTKDGFTVFQYNSDFPLITNPIELIEPTRYLTTNTEFNTLLSSIDKKEAIDKFWINIAGSKDIARDLIKKYYGRVQMANIKFSSYMEGWKTDRGLIYIIFGPPSTVYKDDVNENWNYTNQLYIPNLTFAFKRMANPFSDNDYSLIRQANFEYPFYMAVDQWRQGRIANEK